MTLAERLRHRLAENAHRPARYAGDQPVSVAHANVRAAVLIAITDRAEPGLILTQRPDSMRKHAGQVAFPGGRVDAEDSDAIAAALREADEEIALAPAHVEIVGTLDPYATITGYHVTPVLGVVAPDLPLVANAAEVAAVFEVPLAFLLDPANVTEHSVMVDGHHRHYREILWNDRRIWGATAAMLANLAARLA